MFDIKSNDQLYMRHEFEVCVCEMSMNMNTHRKTPRTNSIRPEMSVAVNTRLRQSCGFSVGLTFVDMVAAMINELEATVPTARYFELPNTAQIRGGTKLESAHNN